MLMQTAARCLVRLTPPAMGTAVAQALATRTRPARVHPAEQAAMARATPLADPGGRPWAWCWGEGPTVLLVHGWGGRGAQMAPLAAHLGRQGFRAVVFDVTGHGDSPQRRSGWSSFLLDTASVARRLGVGLHACIGHSAGGLTMMAARRVHGLQAARYACICAPSHPFPPVEAVRRALNPPEGVLRRYRHGIAAQFHTDWEALQAGAAWAGAGPELLLVYDPGDRYIPHTEGDRLQALCPGARLVKTQPHGHTRILSTPELASAVTSFLQR